MNPVVEDITSDITTRFPQFAGHMLFARMEGKRSTCAVAVHSDAAVLVGGARVSSSDVEQAIVRPDGIGALSADMTMKAAAAVDDPVERPGGMKVAVVLKNGKTAQDLVTDTGLKEAVGVELGTFMRAIHRETAFLEGRTCITGADMGSWPILGYAAKVAPKYVCDQYPSDFTAAGIVATQRVIFASVCGRASLDGLTAVVVGAGGVGQSVARRLLEMGVRVKVADKDPARAAEAEALGAEVINYRSAYHERCDLLSPCAYGGLTWADTQVFRCTVIDGAANSLFEDKDERLIGRSLERRGIAVGRDFIVNCGGLLFILFRRFKHQSDEEIYARVERIAAENMQAVIDLHGRRLAEGAPVSMLEAGRCLAIERLAASEDRSSVVTVI